MTNCATSAPSVTVATLRFFTICAKNFLGSADVLAESIRRMHPSAPITIYLCDRDLGYIPQIKGVEIEAIETVGIPRLESMIKNYNISELCTAVKPFCFLREISHGESQTDCGENVGIVYLDPDIELYSPLAEVVEALDRGSELVLTPHVIKPSERVETSDQQYLKYGIYNLGFVAARGSNSVKEVMHWWGRRLADQCVINLAEGLFVDQKWADLLPAFLDKVTILRHPGYNVAYWNLHERRIHGSLSEPKCNGLALRFAHFSGLFSDRRDQISRHSRNYFLTNSFGYGPLVRSYREKLSAPSRQYYRNLPFSFFWNDAQGNNAHANVVGSSLAGRSRDTFLLSRQFFSLADYDSYRNRERSEFSRRHNLSIDQLPSGNVAYRAFCGVCGFESDFEVGNRKSESSTSSWVQTLTCVQCRMSAVERAGIHIFIQEFAPQPSARIYLSGASEAVRAWMTYRFENVICGDDLGNGVPRGALSGGIQNEDALNLSIESQSIDHVLSFECSPGERNRPDSLAELYRVLRRFGQLVLIPSGDHSSQSPASLDETLIDAVVDRGNLANNREFPEYVSEWSILDDLRNAAFPRPFGFNYCSERFAYFEPDAMIWVAEKLDVVK